MPADTISIADLKRRLDCGRPLDLVDVRTPAEFAAGHAAGARSVPLDALDPAALAPRPDAPIYLICQSGGRSAKAWALLHAAGVGPAFSVDGGTAAWARAGLPVDRAAGGRGVISLERQVRIAAGSLALLGSVLARFVHPYFLAVPAFVGAGLIFAGVTDFCGMGLLLAKLPWNRAPAGRATRASE